MPSIRMRESERRGERREREGGVQSDTLSARNALFRENFNVSFYRCAQDIPRICSSCYLIRAREIIINCGIRMSEYPWCNQNDCLREKLERDWSSRYNQPQRHERYWATLLRAFIYYACMTNCLFISNDLVSRYNGHLTDALTDDSLQLAN